MQVITVILQYTLSIVALSIIVIFHELGHFLMAKLSGVHVEEFFMGFGPKIWKFKDRKGTVYGIRAIPLGGYNKLLGMDRSEPVLSNLKNKAYYNKPIYKKLLILIGGPGFSIFFAVLLIMIYLSMGVMVPTTVIDYVETGAPADTDGFEIGDKVVSLEGRSINSWDDFSAFTKEYPGEEVKYKVIRQDEELEIKVKLDIKDSQGYLGISPSYEKKSLGFAGTIKEGFRITWDISVSYVKLFGMLVTGRIPLSQARPVSPVGVVSIFQQSVSIGIQDFIFFVALVSILMGYGNLIPILPLDGGNILIVLIEAIIRKPVPRGVIQVISSVGVFILVSLTILAFILDIINPFDIINL